jgi:hypothetical protein
MIGLLPGLPPNVAGFRASGEVTKEDFETVIFPEVKRHTALSGKLNFVFYVDTPLKNFSIGAWIRDIWLGMKQFASWRKIAIISDVEKIRNFTDNISFLLPGEYKGFSVAQLQDAVRWAATEEVPPETSEDQIPAHIEQLLPPQVRGESTMTTAQVTAGKEADARFIYERATNRLLDVNEWTDHCGALSASFQLTDDGGETLKGRAAVGDYIRIHIPGPATDEGRGYDWVKIEKIEQPPPDGSAGLSLLQVRPCANPQIKDASATAHFLEDSATSTFIIEWTDRRVSATVYGRNEVPNTAHPGAIDKVRNAVIGTLGAIGLSKIQWKALVEGLLDRE